MFYLPHVQQFCDEYKNLPNTEDVTVEAFFATKENIHKELEEVRFCEHCFPRKWNLRLHHVEC